MMSEQTMNEIEFPNGCRLFLEELAKNFSEEQFLIKSCSYQLDESEIPAEVSNWSFQYLWQRKCPNSLFAPITRSVLENVQQEYRKCPEIAGFDATKETYDSSKIKQIFLTVLKELCHRLADNSELSKILSMRVDTFTPPDCVVSAIRNTRRTMEDRHVCIPDFDGAFDTSSNNESAQRSSFYAVFDGHDGINAAFYSVSQLPYLLANDPNYPTDPALAMKNAFQTTDAKFIQKCKKHSLKGGSTAVCALLRRFEKKLFVGWAGDSRALMVKNGQVMQIVKPHKPTCPDEVERIENEGGHVMFWGGSMRVNGILNVTRAIGDITCKPYVTSDPDIVCLDLDGEEDFLIIGCDGLWDFVNEEDLAFAAYTQIQRDPDNLQEVPDQLVELAKVKGSSDNITVVVVFLKQPKLISNFLWPSSKMETIYDKNNGDEFLSGQVLLSNSDKNESYNMDVDHHNNDLIEKPKEIFQATAPLVEDGLKNLISDPLAFLQTSNIENQQHALNVNKDDLTEEKFVLDEQTDISLKNEKLHHQLNDHDHRDHDQEHDEFKQNNHHSDMGPETCVDEDGALYRNDLLAHESEKQQQYEIEIGGHVGEDDEEVGNDPEKEVDDMLSEDTPITEDVAGSNEHLNCGFTEETQSNQLTPEPAAMKNSNEFLNDIIENHNKHIDELGTMPAVDGQQHFEREFEDDFHEELNVDKKIEESKTESVPPVVHESGDESEDEWRYMRLKEGDAEKQALKEILPELEAEQQQQPPHPQSPPSQELEKADTPKEFERSQEPSEIANSGAIDLLGNQEEEEDDDMSSQLNPEAKEFVPSSPLHFDSVIDPLAAVKTLTDEVVSQSPRKGAISMNNIKVPDENDFVTEISNRPSEIDVNLSNDSKATNESNTSVALQEEPYQEMNLKEAMHGSEKEEQASPDDFMLNAGMMRDDIMQRSMQGEEDFFGRTATDDLMNKVQMLPVDDFEGLSNEFGHKISDFGLDVQDKTSEIVSNLTEKFSNVGDSLLNDFSMKNGNFNPFDQHEKQQSPTENDHFGNDFGLKVNEPVLSAQVQGDLLAEQPMIITKSLTPTPEPPVSAPKTPEPVTSAPKTPEPEQISVPATPEPQHHFSVPATPESPISIPASPEPHHISLTPEPQSLPPKSPELSIPRSPEPLISAAAPEEVHQLASPVSKSPEQSCDSLEGSNLVATSPSPIEPQQIIENLIPTSPTQPAADLIVDNHVFLDEKPTEIVKQQETAEPTPAKENILGKVAAVAVAATAAVAAGAAVAVSKAKVPDTKKPAAGAAKTAKAPAAAAPKRITSATSASSDKAKPTTAALKAKTSTTSTTATARPRTVPSAMASSRTTKTTTTTTAAAKPKVEAKTTTTTAIKRTLVKPKIEDAAKPAAAKTLASKTGSTKTTVTSRTVGSATAQRPRTVPSSLATTTRTTTASTRPALSPSAKTTTAAKPIGSPRTTLASTLRKAETLKSPTSGTTTTAKRLTTVTKTTTVTTTSPRTGTSTNVTSKTQTTRTSGGPTRTSTLTTSATKPLAKRSPAKTPTSASKAAAAAKKAPVTKSPGPIRAPEGYKMNGTVEGVNVEIKLNGSLSAEPKKD